MKKRIRLGLVLILLAVPAFAARAAVLAVVAAVLAVASVLLRHSDVHGSVQPELPTTSWIATRRYAWSS